MGATLFITSNAVLSAAKFLLVPLYTHYLVPEQYGILGTVNTINVFLIMLMSLGIERALSREYFDYNDDPDELRNYLLTIFIFMVALNLVVILALWSLSYIFSNWLLSEIKLAYFPFIPLALGIAASTTLYSILMVIFQVKHLANYYVAGQIGRFILIVAFTLFFLIKMDYGASGILFAELIGTSLSVIIIFIVMYPMIFKRQADHPYENAISRLKGFSTKFDFRKIKGTLALSIPFLVFDAGGWVIAGLDRIFLAKFRNMEEVGIYALGATLAQVLNVLINSINTAYIPFFFQVAKKDEKPWAVFSRLSDIYVLVIGATCLAGIFFSREIMAILAPASYAQSNHVMQVLLLSALFWGLYRIVVLPIIHLKKTNLLIVFIVTAMGASLACNLLLIPVYGLSGAAWTNVIAYALLFFMALFKARRVFSIEYNLGTFWSVILIVFLSGLIFMQDYSLIIKVPVFASIMILFVLLNLRRENHFYFFGILKGTNK